MFTRIFWQDAAERALKTFAQSLLSLFTLSSAGPFNILSINFTQAIGVAAGAVVISLLMSIVSAGATGTPDGSLLK